MELHQCWTQQITQSQSKIVFSLSLVVVFTPDVFIFKMPSKWFPTFTVFDNLTLTAHQPWNHRHVLPTDLLRPEFLKTLMFMNNPLILRNFRFNNFLLLLKKHTRMPRPIIRRKRSTRTRTIKLNKTTYTYYLSGFLLGDGYLLRLCLRFVLTTGEALRLFL